MSRLLSSYSPNAVKVIKTLKDIPGPQISAVVLDYWKGRLFRNSGGMYERFQTFWDQYGDIVKLEVPSRPPIICVYRPDLAETFLRATGSRPNRPGFEGLRVKRELAASMSKGPYYKGLLTTQGQEWWEFRSKVQQVMLRPGAVVKYAFGLEEIADEFLEKRVQPRLKNMETPDDFLHDLYKWALESIALLVLNQRLGCLEPNLSPNSEQIRIINSVQGVFEKSRLLDEGLGLWRKFPQLSRLFNSFGSDYDQFLNLSKKYIKLALDDEDPESAALLRSLAAEGFNEDMMTALAVDAMFAGIDTSSHLIAFTMYYLAKHPEVQTKLYDEIMHHFPNEIRPQDLYKMSYMRAVIKEGLRLRSPAIGVIRYIEKPVQIGGYQIDEPALYFALNLHMCNSERYFKDSSAFRPERWLRGQELQEEIHPFLMLPFGHGSRMCVGKRISEQESIIFLCKMLKKYSIEWHKKDLEMTIATLTKPANPLNFTLIERKST